MEIDKIQFAGWFVGSMLVFVFLILMDIGLGNPFSFIQSLIYWDIMMILELVLAWHLSK